MKTRAEEWVKRIESGKESTLNLIRMAQAEAMEQVAEELKRKMQDRLSWCVVKIEVDAEDVRLGRPLPDLE